MIENLIVIKSEFVKVVNSNVVTLIKYNKKKFYTKFRRKSEFRSRIRRCEQLICHKVVKKNYFRLTLSRESQITVTVIIMIKICVFLENLTR